MTEFDRYGLFEYFLSEAEDHINTLDRGISELGTAQDTDPILEEMLRAAHTLKGAAALVKLNVTSTIAHRMEDILEELRDSERRATKGILEILSYMLDAIKGLIYDISEGREEGAGVEQGVFAKVDELMEKEKAEPVYPVPAPQEILESEEVSEEISETFPVEIPLPEKREAIGRRREDFEFFSGNFVKVDVRKVEEMLNLIGEITIKKNYLLQKTKDTGDIADEIFFVGRRLLKEVDNFAERYGYSLPGNIKYIDPLLSEFGELEFDRYDDLNLFSRKLQEITSDIAEALRELSDFFGTFGDNVKNIDNLIKLLRSDISESRMIDIGRLLQRFVRPVKEMAKQYDKKIELMISGGDTKIDKVIFERLFDPLMHILRNALIHGIESPAERLQKGKKEEGLVFLSAKREGNAVIVEVNDNGRGIDTERLLNQAVKDGLFRNDYTPSKEELLSLIFMPGFTTSETADMASGRGMGMSAVRRLISAINGVVEMDTDSGSGTTFRIKVPSTLVITNAIVFSSGDVEFIMPASLIEEIIMLDVKPDQEESPSAINYRETNIPVRNLSEILGIAIKTDKLSRPVIVCNVSNKRAGLIVDEIVGQEETIIKPINRFLGGLHLYSGTTISGDGKVRLVINPLRIFEEQIQPVVVKPVGVESYVGRRILIVDDSLSVRKYVGAFLEARKFRIYSASNGAEALEVLEETPVDMIITDLEMPVMHGYELISRLKESDRLKEIPVIVLTSRSAGKHREKALQSGASGYLIKPFDEKSLLEILKRHLSTADRT